VAPPLVPNNVVELRSLARVELQDDTKWARADDFALE
jgi:hypothetical protein